MISPRRIWLGVVAAALAAAQVGAATRTFTKVLPLAPGGTVRIDTYRGEILVEEAEVAEVRLALEIAAEAATEVATRDLLAAVEVQAETQERAVAVTVRNPRETGLRPIWREHERTELRFRLTVPARCDLQVQAGEGGVSVGNLTGQVRVRLEKGVVSLRRIDGSVDVAVDFGDLVLSRCSGAVTVRLRKGHMQIGTIGGRADLTNDTGDIEVMAVRGSLVASAQMGDVKVGFAPGLTADSKVTTAAGNIIAEFHGRTACRLEATATWGRVRSEMAVDVEAGSPGSRSLTGRINGGGPAVVLRASGGSVGLRTGLILVDEAD